MSSLSLSSEVLLFVSSIEWLKNTLINARKYLNVYVMFVLFIGGEVMDAILYKLINGSTFPDGKAASDTSAGDGNFANLFYSAENIAHGR
jgi:hypothetical protein